MELKDYIEKYAVKDHEVFNMNKNLIEIYIPKHLKDWNNFRSNGIGASEIGIVLGVNNWNILPKLVEEKVGTLDPYKEMNEAMFSGLMAEEIILKRWKYADGTERGYMDNYMQGNIIRTCQPVNTYITNTKYPYLFVSLDARVEANQRHLGGDLVPYEWPLEFKTIRQWEASKWLNGIPATYRFQVQAQMLVTETDYAELAVLEDGVSFKVYPFRKDERMQEMILTKCEQTWGLIIRLKEIHEEVKHYSAKGNNKKVKELQAEYENLLPLPADEESAKEYYSDKMLREAEEFMGTEDDARLVTKRTEMAEAIKMLKKEQQAYENLIMRRFVLEKAEYMDFGKQNGRVRYYIKEGGKNHQLDFRPKEPLMPDLKVLEQKVNLIIE